MSVICLNLIKASYNKLTIESSIAKIDNDTGPTDIDANIEAEMIQLLHAEEDIVSK